MTEILNKIKNRWSQRDYPAIMTGLAASREGQKKYRKICQMFRNGHYNRCRDFSDQLQKTTEKYFQIPESDGYLIVPQGTLAEVDQVVELSRRVFAENGETRTDYSVNNKEYYQHVPKIREHVHLGSPLLNLAMHPAIVGTVASYIDILPILHWIYLFYSPKGGYKTGVPSGSQMFHLDHEDLRQVKVFVAIEDITEESGPFTLIKASASDRICKELGDFKPIGKRHTDEDLLKRIDTKSELVKFTAKAGDLVFVDTNRCFHFGSRTLSGSRLMLGMQFLSPFSTVIPWNYNNKLPMSRLISEDKQGLVPWQKFLMGRYH